MCDFCKDCNKTESEFQNRCESSWNEYTTIVRYYNDYGLNNNYGLYVPCEDDYYSGTVLDIEYCPKCGEKLG